MIHSIRIPMLIVLSLVLASCGSSSDSDGPLTPLPNAAKKQEPSNEALTQAISEYVVSQKGPLSSGYDYVRYDLNNDGRRDALVLFKRPYTYWCNDNGCPMLVFKANAKTFSFVNAVAPIRRPVHISTMQTNGWRDLVVRVSGRSDRAKDVAMRFNGNSYPSDPSNLPPFPKKNFNGFTRAFMNGSTLY